MALKTGSTPKKQTKSGTASNDKISGILLKNNLVPEEMKGTDKFLDVVNWNIRYFHNRDSARVKMVTDILSELNADVIVLMEILEDSLAEVVAGLGRRKAGHYDVRYGTTGGNQRIAMLWDLDWVRSKDTVAEVFSKGDVVTREGKEVFPRLPLRGYFTSLSYDRKKEPFDFQLLGVHLKSQRGGGGEQREMAADTLAKWLDKEAPKCDADVIIAGDWNEPPSSPTWKPFHLLEKQGKAAFKKINDDTNISHLMYRNKSDVGSRLDLQCMSVSTLPDMKERPTVVQWKPLMEMLDASPEAKKIKEMIKRISNDVSDHMPVVSRFYFTAQD
jgi:endonuclease/exonuclease/phosphatase family metal-dependent hydrolase